MSWLDADTDATRELAPEAWSEYLDAVSRELPGAEVSIEIITAPDEIEVAARHLALRAVGYDYRDDVFEVALAGGEANLPSTLRHVVDHPKRIVTDSWTLLAPMMIAVDGRDGVRTIVRIDRDSDLDD